MISKESNETVHNSVKEGTVVIVISILLFAIFFILLTLVTGVLMFSLVLSLISSLFFFIFSWRKVSFFTDYILVERKFYILKPSLKLFYSQIEYADFIHEGRPPYNTIVLRPKNKTRFTDRIYSFLLLSFSAIKTEEACGYIEYLHQKGVKIKLKFSDPELMKLMKSKGIG